MSRWIKTLTTTTIAVTNLAACTPTVVDTSCSAFKPIRYSASQDRPETVTQIREHNAVWDRLCK